MSSCRVSSVSFSSSGFKDPGAVADAASAPLGAFFDRTPFRFSPLSDCSTEQAPPPVLSSSVPQVSL